jgi:type VI secretion system secreted protein VgrG
VSPRASNVAYVQLEIDGAEDLGVFRFSGREAISELYRFTVDFLAPTPLSRVFRNEALLRVAGADDGPPRFIHGIVHTLGSLGTSRRGRLQRLEIVPRVALLQYRQDCRIFQNMTVEEICRKVIAQAGLPPDALRFTLCVEHAPREYCVQYRESDWAFIRRILAEDGCNFYFEHIDTAHTMVVSDDPQSRTALPGGQVLRVVDHNSGMIADADHIIDLCYEETIGPGRFSARDYNYLEPSDTLDSQFGGEAQDLEIYDYPGHYENAGAGRAITQARLGALQVPLRRARGRSGCARITPGYAIVGQHDLSEDAMFEGQLRILEVTHTGEQPQALGEDGAGKPSSYLNEFVCMPADLPIRAPCPRKPTIPGTQTAVVTGASGEEIFTDEFGRIKVQFHWDRQGKFDDNSSCWVRVSQAWAGPGWGALHIPRVGHEVVVAFLDGNPDRPLVIGSVYHAVHGAPTQLPEKRTRSAIRSESSPGGGGNNELAFEDSKGNEEVYLHAQKDLRVAVENDAGHSVGHDETRTVANDRTRAVGHNETLSIGKDLTSTVGNNQNETVGNDKSVAVGKNESLTVGNNRDKSIRVNESMFVGADQNEQIGANRSVTVGAQHRETIGANMSVEIGGALSETVGQAKTEAVALASTETVGLAKALTVGGAYAITVGGLMTTNVALMQTQSVGMSQTETVGMTKTVTVGDRLAFICGESSIILERSGKIIITGTDITVTSSGQAELNGKNVKISGDPIELN